MNKLVQIFIDYHNEDPDAFDGMGGSGYNANTRAEQMIHHLEESAERLGNDPMGLGELISNIIKSLTPEEIKAIDSGLVVR